MMCVDLGRHDILMPCELLYFLDGVSSEQRQGDRRVSQAMSSQAVAVVSGDAQAPLHNTADCTGGQSPTLVSVAYANSGASPQTCPLSIK